MMKYVIAVIYVKIENFKSMTIHVYIQYQQEERVGAYVQGNSFQEDNLLCSI